MTTRRPRPLAASSLHAGAAGTLAAPGAEVAPSVGRRPAPTAVPTEPPGVEADQVPEPTPASPGRLDRLTTGVAALRIRSRSLLSERTLVVAGGITAPIGILVILLGWFGASRTPLLFEQIPYLISGGLLGVALVFLGAFFYFTHWLTELVKEHRTQSEAVVEAIARLEATMARAAVAPPVLDATATAATTPDHHTVGAPRRLLATANGTMAHRPDCVVVAGKADLRELSPTESLAPCLLCNPATG